MNRKPTQLLAILLVVTLSVMLYTPGVTRAQEVAKGMGLIPSSPARYKPSLPPGLKVGKQPPAVDLSAGLPPIGDQGSQNSCVAWATTYYYKTFQEDQERAWGVGTADHQFSPAMTYNMRTFYTPNDCTVDWGMRVPDAMDILIYDGALPLATFPYSSTDTCTQPAMPLLVEAADYGSLGYGAFFVYGEEGNVTPDQIEALKAHLAGGDLLVMGIPIYSPSFDDPVEDMVGLPTTEDSFEGYHIVAIVGYDDAVGGFKFANSWGASYAGDGYAWLSYDFVQQHAVEAWWMWDKSAPAEGCVEGAVRDIGGDPVSDVEITLEGPTSWTGTTNISGTYASGPVLPYGAYTISASKPGFAISPESAEIVVSEGACAVQDFVATEAVLSVNPGQETLSCGETTTISIDIRDVVNLYGVQFDLTFDPTVIEVIDPDGDPSNGTIVPGEIFPPNEYEVAYEQVDNGSGLVEFAISLLRVPKAPPFAGSGTVAEITVRGLADGVSPLVLVDAKLANSEGQPIDALTEASSIAVECQTGVFGYAYLESRSAHDGITVTIEGTGLTTTTDASGYYSFSGVPSGTYTVTFEYDEFLDVETGIWLMDGFVIELCDFTLLAGDLNNDEVVDILDLALCAAEFGSTSPDADVNADGIVDIYDLVLIGKNFKLMSPQLGACG